MKSGLSDAERREQNAERQRRYYHANADKVRAQRRAQSAVNRPWRSPGHVAATFAHKSNKRAQRLGVPGHLTAAEVRAITGPCAYCGEEAGGWDHVVPMGLGGPNTPANLVPCCRPCNSHKNLRTPDMAGMPLRRSVA